MSILIPADKMDTLYFQIAINGKNLSLDLARKTTVIEVDDSDDEASLLRITLADTNKVFLNNPSLLEKNQPITLDMGFYKDHSQVFKGNITHAEASYGEDGIPLVVIGAIDESNVFSSKAKTRKFTKTKVSSVVEKVAKENGFIPDVTDTKTIIDEISQDGESDAKFLYSLADSEAFIWYVYKKAGANYLFFGKRMNDKAQSDDTLDYNTGNFGIVNFNPMRVEKNKSIDDATSSNIDSSGKEDTSSSAKLSTMSNQVILNPKVNVLVIDGTTGRVVQENLVGSNPRSSANITSMY